MLGTAQTVQCQLMSVSQVMAQERLTVVDLLKVRWGQGCWEVFCGTGRGSASAGFGKAT
jgi:ATP:corrinoid adenosyltransferase